MNIGQIFENAPDLDVETIMTDSRSKAERGIFFCIQGMVNDGHDFIDQAIANGAICIVHSRPLKTYQKNITYLMVKDTNQALNDFTAAFYGDVTRRMQVFGVTGTNGKSTIAWVTRWVVDHFTPCGYIGTIGMYYQGKLFDCPLTTPDPVFLHRSCRQMYDAGCRALALEVSSIGLEEHRVDAVAFDVVSFTNLTHDHLDYHGNFENYYHAKRKLFTMITPRQKAVINIDDKYGLRLTGETTGKVVTYAIYRPADYRAVNVRLYPDHTEFTLVYQDRRYSVTTNLVAEFNVYNLLAVIGMTHEAGYPLDEILELLKSVPQVLGRMEHIDEGQPFDVLVDYAHTPDGFEKVFTYGRAITAEDKRMIVVFGSAGHRDARKRSELGQIADRNCKVIILTTEDCRMEDPEAIAAQIKEGIQEHPCTFVEDRFAAIQQALEIANPGDTVLILGKGDETYQDLRDGKQHWMGDNVAARQILRNLYGGTAKGDGK